jgi:hypothetical protein
MSARRRAKLGIQRKKHWQALDPMGSARIVSAADDAAMTEALRKS